METWSMPWRSGSGWKAKGSIFSSTSDSEVILHLIARSQKPTIEEAIQEALSQLTGGLLLIFLTKDRMISLCATRADFASLFGLAGRFAGDRFRDVAL